MNSNSNIFPIKFELYKPKREHPNWNKLNKEALKLSIKIAKNITLQKSVIQRTIFQKRKIKAIIRTLKNLFINKGRMNNSNHNFIPLFYIWSMTNACNFNCKYCSNHRGEKYPDLYKQGLREDLTTKEGKKLIKIMKKSSAIYFCGGEPTLRKDLPELLQYSSKLNMFNMINTNGSLIGDLLLKPAYKNFLLKMDVIIISLDSLTVSQLSDIYNVNEKTANKLLRNILTLRILQNYVPFKLVANTVITLDTIEECFSILDWCNDLDITFSPVSANIKNQPDYDLIQNPKYIKLVEKILKRSEKGYPMIASTQMLRRLLKAENIECFPTVFDHVDYNGEIFWPCKAFPNGKKINVLKYNNIGKVHNAASKLLSPNNFHGNAKNQCQGQCSWMQNVVTETYGKALKNLTGSGIFSEILNLL
ncbi:MAG: radical SAM protein [Candidatus Lokiarchaeota archaeon]|nr:radical SAM protein [Candidatus Lokiarchaeota archaeon]